MDGISAVGAGLAFAPVYFQLPGEVAGVAVRLTEILQGGAALVDGAAQDFLHRLGEPIVPFPRNAATGPGGMDARLEKGFVGVDVAHAHHHVAVHEEGLHGDAPAARKPIEMLPVKIAGQRFGAEGAQQRMLQGILLRPEHSTETAWIAQPQAPVAEDQVDVVVLAGRRVWGQDAQAARHAQVQDEGAVGETQQQVLGAPLHLAQLSPCQPLRQRSGDGPAQAAFADHHCAHAPAFDERGDPPAGGLHFGQFRHGGRSLRSVQVVGIAVGDEMDPVAHQHVAALAQGFDSAPADNRVVENQPETRLIQAEGLEIRRGVEVLQAGQLRDVQQVPDPFRVVHGRLSSTAEPLLPALLQLLDHLAIGFDGDVLDGGGIQRGEQGVTGLLAVVVPPEQRSQQHGQERKEPVGAHQGGHRRRLQGIRRPATTSRKGISTRNRPATAALVEAFQ